MREKKKKSSFSEFISLAWLFTGETPNCKRVGKEESLVHSFLHSTDTSVLRYFPDATKPEC